MIYSAVNIYCIDINIDNVRTDSGKMYFVGADQTDTGISRLTHRITSQLPVCPPVPLSHFTMLVCFSRGPTFGTLALTKRSAYVHNTYKIFSWSSYPQKDGFTVVTNKPPLLAILFLLFSKVLLKCIYHSPK